MSEEQTPFKSIKITLSEEALGRLAYLRQKSYYRSDSATIEECIRAIFDIALTIYGEIDRAKTRKQKPIPLELQAEALRRIGFRIARFIPPSEEMMKRLTGEESSAGT